MRLASQQWHSLLAGVLEQAGGPAFAGALVDAIDEVAGIDSAILFAFRQRDLPLILHDRLAEAERDAFYSTWLSGVYLLSPFYRAFRQGIEDGFHLVQELAPAGFRTGEYYRKYYLHTASSDLGGFMVRIDADATVVVTVGRRLPRQRFTRAELVRLRAIWPMVSALVVRHSAAIDAGRPELRQAARHARFEQSLAQFGGDALSRREREVARLLLSGHSSKAVARELGISPETARVHRKHIYGKLGVSSQGDLFSLFIAHLVDG